MTNSAVSSTTITVSVTPDDNHIAPSDVTFNVSAVAYNPLASVTSSHLGYYVCTDGSYYSSSTAVPSGKTVAGMIAYVSSTGHGLILAKSDANNGNYANWSTIYSACSSYTPVITAGGSSLTWKLPSKTDWENMGATNTSWSTLSSRLSDLSSIGVSTVQLNIYWSSTADGSNYYYYNFFSSTWGSYSSNYYGRACAAF